MDQVEWPVARRYFATQRRPAPRRLVVRSRPRSTASSEPATPSSAPCSRCATAGSAGGTGRARRRPRQRGHQLRRRGARCTRARNPNKVRNRVKWGSNYGIYGGVRLPDQYRSRGEPQLFAPARASPTAPIPLPWDRGRRRSSIASSPPPSSRLLGTIIPADEEVAQIVCAEFGDRWTVSTATADTVVQVVGHDRDGHPGHDRGRRGHRGSSSRRVAPRRRLRRLRRRDEVGQPPVIGVTLPDP